MKLVLLFLIYCSVVYGKTSDLVSCGSITKLFNTYYKVRLHSHDVKYGSGSGQQSVTGTQTQEDHNSNWLIKGTMQEHCKRGEPIACGQKVRLEHVATKRNLHSHLFTSPLSDQQEISAFGDDGKGDSGDVWRVLCDGDYWNRRDEIRLVHVDTDVYLSVTSQQYGRPISGQSEIVGNVRMDAQSKWKAMEGVFVLPTDFVSTKKEFEHTEL